MISTWIWHRLPGNAWVRSALLVVALAALTLVLFEWVFPWVSSLLPFQEQIVE